MAAKRSHANALSTSHLPSATRSASTPSAPGAAVSSRLDRIIHDRTRLAIMSALAVNDVLSFNELKALTETTDGNLSVHARKLEDAGYVLCEKSFAGRTPRTDYKLSAAGKRALEKYLDHMDALIRATRKQK
jgi:DNA-binding transcriptional ArsR family regulator